MAAPAVVDRRSAGRAASGIDHVADHLTAEFAGTLPPETVRQVAVHARRDLEREVPPEALAEFTHRLAWQRLVDLRQPTPDWRRGREAVGVG